MPNTNAIKTICYELILIYHRNKTNKTVNEKTDKIFHMPSGSYCFLSLLYDKS